MAHQGFKKNFTLLFKTYPLSLVSSHFLRFEGPSRLDNNHLRRILPERSDRKRGVLHCARTIVRRGEVAEPADKPGSVVDSHSSRRIVTDTLKQPTRRHRGPRHCLPIWSCSRWGLPCRPVARLAVRSYRTISPLPDPDTNAGPSAVSFCCTFRRLAPPRRYLAPCPVEPGLSSAFFRMTRLSGRLRHRHCRMVCGAVGRRGCPRGIAPALRRGILPRGAPPAIHGRLLRNTLRTSPPLRREGRERKARAKAQPSAPETLDDTRRRTRPSVARH